MNVYGDTRSGNCDKVRFTLDYLRQAHLEGFDMARRPCLQAWIERCETELASNARAGVSCNPMTYLDPSNLMQHAGCGVRRCNQWRKADK